MTEDEIRQQILGLNKLFNVPPCGVHFIPNPRYGQDAVYYPFDRGVTFNSRHLDTMTPSVVAHEFAHHLVLQRHSTQSQLKRARKVVRDYAKRLRAWDFGYSEQERVRMALRCKRLTPARKRQIHHGDDFVLCLKQIIRKTGMDYNTSREYVTVAKKLGR